MTGIRGIQPDGSQEPGSSSGFHTWMEETQALRSSSAAFVGILLGSWSNAVHLFLQLEL